MGCILVLECLLPGTRGRVWLCIVLSDIEWPRCSRNLALRSLAWYWQLPGVAIGDLGRKEEIRSG
jgi:hypothetical protein